MGLENITNNILLKKIGPVSVRSKGLEWALQTGTSWERDLWNRYAKKQHPYIYAVGKVFEWVDDTCYAIYHAVCLKPKWYVKNRFINKTHTIRCTGLKAGEWHSGHERLLYGVMCLAGEHVRQDGYDMPQGRLYKALKDRTEIKPYDDSPMCNEWLAKDVENHRPLVEAFIWWENVYPSYDKEIERLYDLIPLVVNWTMPDEGRNRIYKQIEKVEIEKADAIKMNLKKVIDCIDQMWD